MSTERAPLLEERLRAHIKIASATDCWPWQGNKHPDGYGMLKIQGSTVYTHRLAYQLYVAPLLAGQVVRHTCDNPPCCNPNHLRAGSDKDNAQDKIARRRHHNQNKTHCPQGHPYNASNTTLERTGRGNGLRRRCKTCLRDAYYSGRNNMATKTTSTITDDLTGEEGARTHSIAFDGRTYEVDLTDESWNTLIDGELSALIAAARPVKNISKSALRFAPTVPDKRDNAAIRAWAQQNGHPLGDRGRIPAVIIDAYNAAHPTQNGGN